MSDDMLEFDAYKLITGDALEQLKNLPDESVQCCLTSPPIRLLQALACGTLFYDKQKYR